MQNLIDALNVSDLPDDVMLEIFFVNLMLQTNINAFLNYITSFRLISKRFTGLINHPNIISQIKQQIASLEVSPDLLNEMICECFEKRNIFALDLLLSHPLADKELLIAEQAIFIPFLKEHTLEIRKIKALSADPRLLPPTFSQATELLSEIFKRPVQPVSEKGKLRR